jgi:predicted nucleic acid-binding protein
MAIVIDASVIIAVITNERLKAKLVEATDEAEVISPDSVHWEVGNAFSAMLKRGRISIEDARAALHAYGHIAIRFVEVELAESLELATDLDIYAYDAYLIRCAQKLRSPLLTLDGGLQHAAGRAGVPLVKVT